MRKKFIFAAVCGALLLSACSKEVENEPLEISLASENYAVEYTGLLKDGIPEALQPSQEKNLTVPNGTAREILNPGNCRMPG